MKIIKNCGVFLLSLLLGSLSGLLMQSVPSAPESKPEIKTAAAARSEEPQKRQLGLKAEKPKPRVFNTEGFWDEDSRHGGRRHNKRILETGELTNGEDIKAKSGESWFGLFNTGGRDYLRSVKIRVRSFRADNFDWKKVSVKDKKKPLLLVKKTKNLKQGKIQTLLREKTWEETGDGSENSGLAVEDGFNRKFDLGEREYTLRTEKGVDENQKPILVLFLETEKTSQMIHYVYFSDPGNYLGELYWVGDLDGDGKLDLYMTFYGYEKGYYGSGLFLSSEAAQGKLVKKFEYFALSTC